MDDQTKREIITLVAEEVRKLFAQSDAVRRSVKQRHLEGDLIFRGLAAKRPSGSSEVKIYFATDTNVLSIWNGTAWTSHTIT